MAECEAVTDRLGRFGRMLLVLCGLLAAAIAMPAPGFAEDPAPADGAVEEHAAPPADIDAIGAEAADAEATPDLAQPDLAPAEAEAETALMAPDAALDADSDAGAVAPPGEGATEAAVPPAPVFDGPIRVLVLGDSLADGLWAGVYRTLRGTDDVSVDRHTRVSSGLSRPDFHDWDDELSSVLAQQDLDIAIVSIGLNDGQPVFHEGRWDHDFATPEWDVIYRGRVEAFMTQLVDAGIPTFWMGLPTVRSDQFDERVQHMNAIYRDAAAETGVYFVETRGVTADDTGAYAAYLNDDEGRQRLMRANDGIHFTGRGYEMLGRVLVDAMADALGVFADDDPA